MRCEKCANDKQNRAQMKESECSKDILKCANEKFWVKAGMHSYLFVLHARNFSCVLYAAESVLIAFFHISIGKLCKCAN